MQLDLATCTRPADSMLHSVVVAKQPNSELVQALPEGMSSLSRLKTLRLDDNRLTSLPAQLLVGCMALQTLSLHGNTCDVEVRWSAMTSELCPDRTLEHISGHTIFLASSKLPS